MTASKGDATSVLTIIHLLTHKRLPYSRNDPIYKFYGKDFIGNSFLLNPEELLIEWKNYTELEASIYVMIASYRNYLHYKKTKETTLQLIHIPFVQKIFNKNRLLQMKNGVVHFKFEDNAKEKNNGN